MKTQAVVDGDSSLKNEKSPKNGCNLCRILLEQIGTGTSVLLTFPIDVNSKVLLCLNLILKKNRQRENGWSGQSDYAGMLLNAFYCLNTVKPTTK